MGKYDALRDYLQNLTSDTVELTFGEIERIIGEALPPSARAGYRQPWSNSRSHVKGKAWLDAGWLAGPPDFAKETIRLRRGTPGEVAKYGQRGSRPESTAALVVRAGPDGILAPEFETQGLVAVGWSTVGDLSEVVDATRLRQLIDHAYGHEPGTGSSYDYELEDFVFGLEPGVQVVTPDSGAREYLIGQVSKGYEFNPDSDLKAGDEPYRHVVRVDWTGRTPRDSLSDATKSQLDRRGSTVFWIDDAALADLNRGARSDKVIPRVWIEKTLVRNRPDRGRDQEHGLGRALWSPKKDKRGADIYAAMREVGPGDVVIHLIDNSEFAGVSIVASPAEDFTGLPDTEWGAREGWRVALRDYQELVPPMARDEFLNPKNSAQLKSALGQGRRLFYNRQLNLNQGAYLTELPEDLVRALDDAYVTHHGRHLPYVGIAGPAGMAPTSGKQHVGLAEEEDKTVNDIYSQLEQAGYHFPEWLVTDYVLSLGTKPLVILSGISGTGKTKIAQLVARHVAPDITVLEETESAPVDEPGSWVHVIGLSEAVHGTTPVPKRVQGLFERFPEERKSEDVVLLFKDERHEARLSNYTSNGSLPMLELWWKKSFRESIEKNLRRGDYLRFTPAYDNGELTIEVTAIPVRRENRTEPSPRIAFLSVRPDWTDNRGLLGYYNPLLQKYQATELLRLLLRAHAHPTESHFVVLDEMNLAKVEYYFSDFLSAMEAGTHMELHDSDEELVLDDTESTVIPKRLKVPSNVFFTGTVNVDETTYMFSPKVLDRANTLEFNEVSLRDYGVGRKSEGDDSFRLKPNATVEEVLASYSPPSPADWDGLSPRFKARIGDLHELLSDDNLHFGYRVANEIARYLNLTAKYVGADALDEAFDIQVLQKVLPKFSGSSSRLREPLTRLHTYLADAGLHRSASKVARMLETLRTVGFVSFVE